MDRGRPDPTTPHWLWATLLVAFPAAAATAGFAVTFRLTLPRATEVLVMAWSLFMTFVASRQMTRVLHTTFGARPRRQASSDD